MFFHFRQNNSGGIFDIDDKVTTHVIIEAENYEDANRRAENIGIYFYGCEQEIDCPCCGDRWYECYSADSGNETPLIYNRAPDYLVGDYLDHDKWVQYGEPYCHVYYMNGEKKSYIREPLFREVDSTKLLN